MSESSAASSTSLRSGIVRPHPYHAVGGVLEGSYFELLPSSASRATSATGFDENIDLAPIARSSSSPCILNRPIQVMSPNLADGSASSASQLIRDPDFDRSMAKSNIATMGRSQDLRWDCGEGFHSVCADMASGRPCQAREHQDGNTDSKTSM